MRGKALGKAPRFAHEIGASDCRALSADVTSARLAAALQHRPDKDDRCREIGGYRPELVPMRWGIVSGL
jgi:hypothetical protein